MKAPICKQGENAASILKRRGFTPGSRLGALMNAIHPRLAPGGFDGRRGVSTVTRKKCVAQLMHGS